MQILPRIRYMYSISIPGRVDHVTCNVDLLMKIQFTSLVAILHYWAVYSLYHSIAILQAAYCYPPDTRDAIVNPTLPGHVASSNIASQLQQSSKAAKLVDETKGSEQSEVCAHLVQINALHLPREFLSAKLSTTIPDPSIWPNNISRDHDLAVARSGWVVCV